MAAPTYNCPFSAGGTVRLCTTVRASNTNAGCPLYDSVNEDCSFAENNLRDVKDHGKETPTEG